MKNIKNKYLIGSALLCCIAIAACTKIGKGFISPTMQYSVQLFSVPKGRYVKSNTLVPDGSSIPLNIKLLHVYDATGKIVDDIFFKSYPVGVWDKSYDPKTDTSYALISAKRSVQQLTPITVNPTSGVIEANSATIYLPSGGYTIDLEVSNPAGSQILKKAMTLSLYDAPAILLDDASVGSFSIARLIANTPTGATNGTYFNGLNNPYIIKTVVRYADTPNVISVRVTDRNGVVFNPRLGEIAKRPNSGINPVPPFLQNLQDYAPDTFKALDTAMVLRFPLVPFPIASLGNGFNMYYRLPTAFVRLDSTSTWSTNPTGELYQGTADKHYLGTFKDGLYDYSLRVPLRIYVPGAYTVNLKLLNVVHK